MEFQIINNYNKGIGMSHAVIIEDPEDSLLDDPLIKKFMALKHSHPNNSKSSFSVHKVEPVLLPFKSTAPRRIVEVGPTASRVAFFTKHHLFKKSTPKSELKIKKTLNLNSYKGVNFNKVALNRRHSIGSLKPKSELMRRASLEKKFVMNNPFKRSLRESELI